MSNIHIARQPIFDNNMDIYGYELLYRQSNNNFYEGVDDDLATASLLDDFFLTEFNDLIGDKRGFINFPTNLILNKVPLMLPKDQTVVEILESVEINQQVVDVCKDLKNAGYMIALDDFILDNSNDYHAEIFELVDIIQIEFSDKNVLEQLELLKKYKGKIRFLAKKVETRDDYSLAIKMGYSLFQGYFFSKPVMINAKSIGTISNNLVKILDELRNPEVDYSLVSELFERDIELSYKLLRMVNSAYFGASKHIESIHQAVVRLGTQELIRWVNLMMLRGVQDTDNAELVRQSLIRGKFLALYSAEIKDDISESDYFISGIFSSIDILLNKSMDEILDALPLDSMINDTLTGKDTKIRRALDAVCAYERAEWDKLDEFLRDSSLLRGKFMKLYILAIKWQRTLI